jgi:hypothetical protein
MQKVFYSFPKLQLFWLASKNLWELRGDLDICDSAGSYWGTFNISIFIGISYPNDIPIVRENSKVIPRSPERHIDENGICCVDIPHALQLQISNGGIFIDSFMYEKVYPYFANQIYYSITGTYANGDYGHEFEGVKQYYSEVLQITSSSSAVQIIEHVLTKRKMRRNDFCCCGGVKKFKKCHWDSYETLKKLTKEQLRSDQSNFQNDSKNQYE